MENKDNAIVFQHCLYRLKPKRWKKNLRRQNRVALQACLRMSRPHLVAPLASPDRAAGDRGPLHMARPVINVAI